MHRRLLALTAALAVAAPAGVALADSPATTVDPKIVSGQAQKDLDAARAAWKAADIRNYQVRVKLSCFCPSNYTTPRTIKVRGGLPVNPPQNLKEVASVNRMFRTVQGAIDRRVSGLTVVYGARGVPKQIGIDVSDRIADEESYYTVDRFKKGK